MAHEKSLTELKTFLTSQVINLIPPTNTDNVYKDECVYCFNTPFETDGLFISLTDFVGVCVKHIEQYVKKTSAKIFLNIKKIKSPNDENEEPKDKVQRLCIKETPDRIDSEHTLRFYPYIDVPIPISQEIGENLQEVCDSVIAHISADLQQRLQSGISQWDGEERPVSKAATDLVQLQYDAPPISYEGWMCAQEGCGLQENLWLNLSDGIIKCGRFAPLSGVNGNGHAKMHYENTGFPLVVKLGTIENDDGDIYSYSEDSPVRDPLLRDHLAHFGLDIKNFKKTVKTTLELELDANLKHEFSTIQEEGATLQSVFGPDFTGLINLGSSCYINSVLQMLYNVPEFLHLYGRNSEKILTEPQPVRTFDNFNCQLAKVVGAMMSGEYSKEGQMKNGIRPTIFRRLAGRGHSEFSTAKQQDAEEYIRHLFQKMDENVGGDRNPVNAFRFVLVNRFVDELSNCVRYNTREDTILSLPIPQELCQDAPNEVNGVRRKMINLDLCLSSFFSEEYIEEYTSPVLKVKGRARQGVRMGSFPDFLIIQIRRFAYTANFDIKKLDVDVQIDDEIDLNAFYSDGKLQPGEQPLPENDESAKHTVQSIQTESIEELTCLGFTAHQAKYALEKCGGDTNSAAEWLFGFVDQVPPETTNEQAMEGGSTSNMSARENKIRNGPGKYRLSAFISHMGSSPHSGHYVAHVKRKDGVWYIFNDEKVAISQKPPKSLGYLYLYERVNQ